jgi:hypothetical protein
MLDKITFSNSNFDFVWVCRFLVELGPGSMDSLRYSRSLKKEWGMDQGTAYATQ